VGSGSERGMAQFLGAGARNGLSAPKNIFLLYSKNSFKFLHIAKQIKKVKLLNCDYCQM
jgi:hypothetical protein